MSNTEAHGPTGSGDGGVDELREQIDQTREELADTVEELANKADVKGRAKVKAAELSGQAKERAAVAAAQARLSAEHGNRVAQEKAVVAREKLPTTLQDQPVILLAAGGVGLLVVLGWLLRRLTR